MLSERANFFDGKRNLLGTRHVRNGFRTKRRPYVITFRAVGRKTIGGVHRCVCRSCFWGTSFLNIIWGTDGVKKFLATLLASLNERKRHLTCTAVAVSMLCLLLSLSPLSLSLHPLQWSLLLHRFICCTLTNSSYPSSVLVVCIFRPDIVFFCCYMYHIQPPCPASFLMFN